MYFFGISSFLDLNNMDLLTWTLPLNSLWKIFHSDVLTLLNWTWDGQLHTFWSLMTLIGELWTWLINPMKLDLRTETTINNNMVYSVNNMVYLKSAKLRSHCLCFIITYILLWIRLFACKLKLLIVCYMSFPFLCIMFILHMHSLWNILKYICVFMYLCTYTYDTIYSS